MFAWFWSLLLSALEKVIPHHLTIQKRPQALPVAPCEAKQCATRYYIDLDLSRLVVRDERCPGNTMPYGIFCRDCKDNEYIRLPVGDPPPCRKPGYQYPCSYFGNPDHIGIFQVDHDLAYSRNRQHFVESILKHERNEKPHVWCEVGPIKDCRLCRHNTLSLLREFPEQFRPILETRWNRGDKIQHFCHNPQNYPLKK